MSFPADTVFQGDVFFEQPDRLASAERHRVWDEVGRLILLVDFAPRLLRLVLAVLLACVAFAGVILVLLLLAISFGPNLQIDAKMQFQVLLAGLFVVLVVGATAGLAVFVMVLGRRSFLLRPDDPKAQPLVETRPVGWSLFSTKYMIFDDQGNCLAGLYANHFYGLWRLRWTAYRPKKSQWLPGPEEPRLETPWESVTGYGESCWFVALEDTRVPRLVRVIAQTLLGGVWLLLFLPVLLFALIFAIIVVVGLLAHGLVLFTEIVLLISVGTLQATLFVFSFLFRNFHRPNCLINRADDGEVLGNLDRQREDRRMRLELFASHEQVDRRVAIVVAVLMDRP
jgi:hypothetical protein